MSYVREEHVDILVVGAGPAGLAAAVSATCGELRVLVVEANARLAEKPCGEAVSASTLRDLGLKPSGRLIRNPVRGARVYAPNGKDYVEISGKLGEGYIIDKRVMLELLAAKARQRGAELWLRSRAVDFAWDGERVREVLVLREGEPVKVIPRVVIACDGMASIFARRLFDRTGYELIPTVQYIMRNVEVPEPDIIDFYVGRSVAPGGYVWVFPRGEDEVGVGIGARGAPPRPLLDKFIERHAELFGRAVVVEVGASAVPIGGQIPRRVRGNVMLCGDAAGQVIPLTGGGIHSASAAGQIAGKVAAEALLEGEAAEAALRRYEEMYDSYWGARIARSLKALRAIERLSDDDLNTLAKLLSGEDIVKLANGIDLRSVALKLLNHPVLSLKLARALL